MVTPVARESEEQFLSPASDSMMPKWRICRGFPIYGTPK